MKWIDIKDKLPKKDGLYLVLAKSMNPDKPLIITAWFDPKFGWSLLPSVWINSITHWMKFPKPLRRK